MSISPAHFTLVRHPSPEGGSDVGDEAGVFYFKRFFRRKKEGFASVEAGVEELVGAILVYMHITRMKGIKGKKNFSLSENLLSDIT